MRKAALSLLSLCCLIPSLTYAQGAAPEMYGVREVIVDYTRFNDAKTADVCGLSREQIANVFSKGFAGTSVPAVASSEAKPPSLGVARIELVPQIYVHTDENLDCVSTIALTAQSRSNVVVPPVPTLRGVTVVYWQQMTMISSSQTTHFEKVTDVLEKMITQFTQQYRIDQPPDIPK